MAPEPELRTTTAVPTTTAASFGAKEARTTTTRRKTTTFIKSFAHAVGIDVRFDSEIRRSFHDDCSESEILFLVRFEISNRVQFM